jgi:hypothetical protein
MVYDVYKVDGITKECCALHSWLKLTYRFLSARMLRGTVDKEGTVNGRIIVGSWRS